MHAWQHAFRFGFLPSLPTAGLLALRDALANDSRQLLQGATTYPPPLQCLADWPVEACCPVSFALWRGNRLTTIGEVEEAFARACHEAGQRLGDPSGGRFFLNRWDDMPRAQARAEVLAEVEAALEDRRKESAA